MLALRRRAALLAVILGMTGVAPAAAKSPPGKPTKPIIQKRIVRVAQAQLGKPYVWGAAGPSSFDCSGLINYVYRKIGKPFRYRLDSWGFRHVGKKVHGRLHPGDIVVANGGGHVVLYVGSGAVIHASRSGTPVRYAPASRYTRYAEAIRRVIPWRGVDRPGV